MRRRCLSMDLVVLILNLTGAHGLLTIGMGVPVVQHGNVSLGLGLRNVSVV